MLFPRFAIALCLAMAGACGPAVYTVAVVPASRALQRAESADAAINAPYEYYYAAAHLDKAEEEAGESHFQDARNLARTAEESAEEAQRLSGRRRRESGR